MSTLTQPVRTAESSSVRGAWRVVAEREITTRIRQKAFLYSALAMVVGIIVTVVLTSILGGRPTDYTVGVVDRPAAGVVSAASDAVDRADEGSTVKPRDFASVAEAERAVRNGDVDAALVATDDS